MTALNCINLTIVSFKDTYYNTINTAITSVAGGFLFDNSKLDNLIHSHKIPTTEIEAKELVRGLGVSIFDGTKNAMNLPQTHTWKSPNPRRWYPVR